MTEQRLADNQFPRLMNKRVLCDYLGVSAPIVDNLIKFDGLNAAAFTPSRNGGKTNTLFIKERVLEWELKVGL
ncbi:MULTISPECIES: hypothetical protein [Periweissella]|uniref:DNA-binding protein n=2 Tax=Periweissella TaxID=2930384 RepID=A0A7X6N2G1_9LACO|nr:MULTISPECIES: hypothetical protein [Periweissella]MCM0599193.1 hypothetical protein [Periweissella fabalis]MCM0601325.1 hypothetical protein [Periweissella ghanensis]NKZ23472.1 hypothetical protein [Periweissella fabalis]CAH0419386.1 hypothetical protein WGH24286_01836 [Periweissella ghanensis]